MRDILFQGFLGTGLIGWVIRIAALIAIPVNRRPSSAMAWLLAIFLIPVIGVLLFLLIGNPKLPKKRRDKQKEINELITAYTADEPDAVIDDPQLSWMPGVASLNRTLGALPLIGGNDGQLIEGYEDSFAAMAAEIDEAQRFVHVEFYILAVDPTTRPFFDALERAVQRGVTVRLLFDHIGSRGIPGYRETKEHLDAIGVQWHLMLAVQPFKGKYQRPDLRNHRKLLVIDGAVGFMGSQNLVDRSYNKPKNLKRGLQWQELMTRVEGPVVRAINAVFLSDWYSETDEILETVIHETAARQRAGEIRMAVGPLACQVVPSGPGFDNENNLKLFNSLLYNAEHRISLTSPYFVPDESLLNAVTTAAYRGVSVELFVSELGDQGLVYHAQRSYYEVMLRAGVRIYLYPAPYILHSKHFTIDDKVSVIGSSNMDMRSFGLNMEVVLMTVGSSYTEKMREVEDHYRAISRELTLEEYLGSPKIGKVLDNLARLTSALQ